MSAPSPRTARRVPPLIRLLVRLYPASFRATYGPAMLAFYAERLDESGGVRRWLRILADLAAGIALEWFHELSSRPLPTADSRPALNTEDRMSVVGHEITLAIRSLGKNVAFTAAAVVTIALGISSTTAIFSVVHSVLLAPLPFPEAERLVAPQSLNVKTRDTWSVTYADFMDWRDEKLFGSVAVYQTTEMDLTGPTEPVRIRAAAVSPQFFQALRATPAMGRVLQNVDFPRDAARAVVISERLWRTRFGSRMDIVGLPVELNAIKRPIVGVMPAGARWPDDVDLYVPLRIASEQDPDVTRRDNYVFQAVARLAPGATFASTRARMAVLAARAATREPAIRGDVTTIPTPALDYALGATTPRALWMLLSAVGLLLLIGCVNVANLQLARAAGRLREMAVRTALGASRFRLVLQMLIESGVLAIAGGALGVALAVGMVRVLVAIAPTDIPRIETARVDLAAVAFAAGISILVALLFGIVPALSASRSDPQLALAEGGVRATGGRRSARTRRSLVIVELALSVVLLVGAGLALRSILRLRGADAGFDTRNVLTASLTLPGVRYDGSASVVRFFNTLRERIAATPEVTAVGISSASPLGGGGFYLGRMMVAEGRDQTPAGEVPINWNVTTPGYFAALRIPILRGRDFTVQDDSAHPPVMIVNERFATQMFPNEDALGKRAMSSRDERVNREIIGIVRDVKYYGASDTVRALVWVPYAQGNAWHQGILTVRTRGAALGAVPAVQRELRALDPGMALANVSTMDDARARSMAGDRLVAVLLGAFASLALVLAAIGIFGVLSYTMEQRSHELGIRVALGARPHDVIALVFRETTPMVVSGAGLGLVAAFVLARLIRSMLYQISPSDPLAFTGAALLLAAVGVVAAMIPARRAAAVDPIVALRSE